jgi:hypothetical protein
MIRLVALCALVVAGCTGGELPPVPYIQLVMVDDAAPLPEYITGAGAWSPLGFEVGFDPSGMPECDPDWYDSGELDCQITITVVRYPHLVERYGTLAISDRAARSIAIDARVEDSAELVQATAHEVGHIILHTGEHTSGGIMGGSSLTMDGVDRELACRQIHICI